MRFIWINTHFFLVATLYMGQSWAAPLNQLNILPIFKDSQHTVYSSHNWIAPTKIANKFKATFLFDYFISADHARFEGDEIQQSREVTYIMACKLSEIAYKGEVAYSGQLASQRTVNFHDRRTSILEYWKSSELDLVVDFSQNEIDNSYKQMFQAVCAKRGKIPV